MRSVGRVSSATASARFAPALYALREALSSYRAHDLKLTVDGQQICGRYLLFEAMNISLLGPNLLLAPDANPSDGALDFVLVPDDRREEFHQYLSYRLERKQGAPSVIVRRAQRVTFAWQGSAVRFDDQAWPKTTTGEKQAMQSVGQNATIDISLWRGGLKMLVPRPDAKRRRGGDVVSYSAFTK